MLPPDSDAEQPVAVGAAQLAGLVALAVARRAPCAQSMPRPLRTVAEHVEADVARRRHRRARPRRGPGPRARRRRRLRASPPGVGRVDVAAADRRRVPDVGAAQAHRHLVELELAVAGDAGDADELAGARPRGRCRRAARRGGRRASADAAHRRAPAASPASGTARSRRQRRRRCGRPSPRSASASSRSAGSAASRISLPPRSTVSRSAIDAGLGQLVGDDRDRQALGPQRRRGRRTGRRPPAGRARSSARRGSRGGRRPAAP